MIGAKQDMAKTNYVLVQNAESLREQLRAWVARDSTCLVLETILSSARTQAAEAHMIRSLSNTLGDNLDESLPCLVYDDNEDHTPVDEDSQHQLSGVQSSLFSEINSLVNPWIISCTDTCVGCFRRPSPMRLWRSISMAQRTISNWIYS